MKLRLLVTDKCNKSCEGCCNNDWDLKGLPVFKLEQHNAKEYKEVLITGGEPTLNKNRLLSVIGELSDHDYYPIFLYTANTAEYKWLAWLLYTGMMDGITLTLHGQEDVKDFLEMNRILLKYHQFVPESTMRLNVFEGIELGHWDGSLWKVKDQIKWIKDCPLPKDEVFMRLKEMI